MVLDRKQVRVFRAEPEQPEPPVNMTKSDAFSFVWELTQEVFSLSRSYDVKSRLQRHVVSVARKRR
jgi:hypothetical protein